MTTLKYKVITSKAQYRDYCRALEALVFSGCKDRNTKDEIALLTLLIEKWDEAHNSFDDLDPIQLLQSFMKEHDLKAKDLVFLLNISKGYVSDILNYKKGLSKEVIRKLAMHFKISQDAFNRPYKVTAHLKNASVMNTKKKLAEA
ncbi:MAG: transcriptional regulator [Niabella sp.]|nr:transcriptional regulator [Niabella sp.]